MNNQLLLTLRLQLLSLSKFIDHIEFLQWCHTFIVKNFPDALNHYQGLVRRGQALRKRAKLRPTTKKEGGSPVRTITIPVAINIQNGDLNSSVNSDTLSLDSSHLSTTSSSLTSSTNSSVLHHLSLFPEEYQPKRHSLRSLVNVVKFNSNNNNNHNTNIHQGLARASQERLDTSPGMEHEHSQQQPSGKRSSPSVSSTLHRHDPSPQSSPHNMEKHDHRHTVPDVPVTNTLSDSRANDPDHGPRKDMFQHNRISSDENYGQCDSTHRHDESSIALVAFDSKLQTANELLMDRLIEKFESNQDLHEEILSLLQDRDDLFSMLRAVEHICTRTKPNGPTTAKLYNILRATM